MLYLARELYTPSGEMLRNRVVDMTCGIVKNVYSFSGEAQSMSLIDEIYLSYNSSIKSVSDITTNPQSCESGDLYAFASDCNGGLVALI